MMHVELATRLTTAADRLTARVLDEMYTNPFWHERFGEGADRHGRQDGRFHIDYLVEAIYAGDPTVLENYARWLQQVLTSRGMCTRHLADHFTFLAAAIRGEAWPDGDVAIALLDAAIAALRYPAGPAHDLQVAAPALATATATALYASHPAWLPRWDEAVRARCIDDVDYHVSYAADAIALAQPAVFASYVVWIAGFLERRQLSREHLVESLRALARVATEIAPATTGELRRVIEPALAALTQGS
jgi:hypothetical protein